MDQASFGYYSKGGFDYQFSGNVYEFVCPLCNKVMRDPTQISCGHVLCRSCLDHHIRTDGYCPRCRQMIDPNSVFPDASMRNRISTLEIRCPNIQCDWRGSNSNVESHFQNCAFRQARLNTKCELCGENIDPLRISQHKKICPRQRCPTCNEPLVHGEHHLCPGDQLRCIYNCGSTLSRAEVSNHQDLNRNNCPTMPRKCPYEKCPQMGISSSLNQHLSSNPIQHALYHKEQFEMLLTKIDSINKKQDTLENENKALKKELFAVQQSHYTTKMKLSSFIRKKLPPLPDESWDDFLPEVTIPTNGVLIWEIQNFKTLFNNANRLTKIYSQPFYTTPAGFKLCCYAQKGDDQFIRVSIQRMEGKFDGILGNLQVESVQISILNLNRPQNLSFTSQYGQPFVGDCTAPIELSSLQSILAFLADPSSAFLEVTVISCNTPSTQT